MRDSRGNWFESCVERCLGNGENTFFWDDIWIGEAKLRETFPRLYELCLDKECSVASAGEWVGNSWVWGMGWRRELRGWEVESINNLIDLLECRKSIAEDPDRWKWKLEPRGRFSVKSGYSKLLERKLEQVQGKNSLCSLIWDNAAAPKVESTAWRIIFRRIATKTELRKRGAIPTTAAMTCSLCGNAEESVDHLFLECSSSWDLWSKCLDWIGIHAALSNKLHENLQQFCTLAKGKEERMLLASLWVCTAWLIWKQRNEVVFNNGVWKPDKLMGEIKSLTWSWAMAMKTNKKAFGPWCLSPLQNL